MLKKIEKTTTLSILFVLPFGLFALGMFIYGYTLHQKRLEVFNNGQKLLCYYSGFSNKGKIIDNKNYFYNNNSSTFIKIDRNNNIVEHFSIDDCKIFTKTLP